MGMGNVTSQCAFPTFPFKGKAGMGMGYITPQRAFLTFPFKE